MVGVLVVGVAAVVGILTFGQLTRTKSAPQPPTPPGGANQPTNAAVFKENGRTFREYGRPYDQAPVPAGAWPGYTDVDGQLAYTARQGDAEFLVFRGQEQGRELSGVGGILGLQGIAGQLAFIVLTPDKTTVVGLGSTVYRDGKNISGAYDYARELGVINGQLTYIGVTFAPDGRERAVVNYGGVEYGAAYGRVTAPFAYEGKLAFIAGAEGDDTTGSVILVDGGKEQRVPASQFDGGGVKDSFGRVVQVVDTGRYRDWAIIDGTLASVELAADGQRAFANYDGKTYGQEYADVYEVANIGGTLALLVSQGGKGVMVYDGQEFGHRYDRVYELPGDKNDPDALDLPPGTFTAVKHIGAVGGKLTYVATVGVAENGELKTIVVKEE